MEKPTVQLTGQDGNAFAIMGTVKKALQRAGYSQEQVEKYLEESMSADYNNLLVVAQKWVNVRQIMFIIERSGVQHYVRYLKNPNKVGWPSEADWTSYSKAHNFERKSEAEKWIRDNEGEGQFSIKEL